MKERIRSISKHLGNWKQERSFSTQHPPIEETARQVSAKFSQNGRAFTDSVNLFILSFA
jgi:hypothetical protein